jgi:hypothetical protein
VQHGWRGRFSGKSLKPAVAREQEGAIFFSGEEPPMKKRTEKMMEQPKPFTPGVTKAMVRQHAYEMFRDKLPDHPLTLEDWVLAEKDLVNLREAEQSA